MGYLNDIIQRKTQEIENLPQYPIVPDCTADFSFLTKNDPIVIAEIKAASPSVGKITNNFNPTAQAAAYTDGGASAISILTDTVGFGGSFEILQDIRRKTKLPLLCKDFIIDERQIDHARMNGADMILLIIKSLSKNRLIELKNHTESIGMKPFIEIQNEDELEIANDIGADFVLLNSRDLQTFKIDMNGAINLAKKVPKNMTLIIGSGINTPQDTANFPSTVNGIIVGTALMQSDNPKHAVKQFHLALLQLS
jgi:indole-3-glycerol phosphate synthase